MPYRDDDSDGSDDRYKFARGEPSQETKATPTNKKKSSVRDRKRQLEEKIKSSMQALNRDEVTKKYSSSSEVMNGCSRQPPLQLSSYQSGGEGTYGGTTTARPTSASPSYSSSTYSSSQDYFTNSPLPSTGCSTTTTTSGIMYELFHCIGTAVRLGTSEIVAHMQPQQPTAIYESLCNAMVGLQQPGMSTPNINTHNHNIINMNTVSPSYAQPRGSYQTVDIPSYHQSGPHSGP